MKTARPKLSELKMPAVFTRKHKGLSRKVILPREIVLVNATASHIAGRDRCLPNRELANIFPSVALNSWFTLQAVLLKWHTNSLN